MKVWGTRGVLSKGTILVMWHLEEDTHITLRISQWKCLIKVKSLINMDYLNFLNLLKEFSYFSEL